LPPPGGYPKEGRDSLDPREARAADGPTMSLTHRFCVAPMMEWTDRAEKQCIIST
jgi:hypothetical protein